MPINIPMSALSPAMEEGILALPSVQEVVDAVKAVAYVS